MRRLSVLKVSGDPAPLLATQLTVRSTAGVYLEQHVALGQAGPLSVAPVLPVHSGKHEPAFADIRVGCRGRRETRQDKVSGDMLGAVTRGFARGHWSSPVDPISCCAFPFQVLLKVGWAIPQSSRISCGEAEIRSRFLTTHDCWNHSKGRRSPARARAPPHTRDRVKLTRGSRNENMEDDSVTSSDGTMKLVCPSCLPVCVCLPFCLTSDVALRLFARARTTAWSIF